MGAERHYTRIAPGSFGGAGNGSVLYPNCGGGYVNLHVLTFIELFTKKVNFTVYEF